MILVSTREAKGNVAFQIPPKTMKPSCEIQRKPVGSKRKAELGRPWAEIAFGRPLTSLRCRRILANAKQQLTRLENGLTVVSAEMPEAASVSIGIWIGVGSRHEDESENGAAHFIEHMLFKGTKRRNVKQIVQEVESLGGYLNAYTSEDQTCYYARGRAANWKTLFDVLWDMYANATFPARELEREREVIKEERAMYLDDPSQLVQEALGSAMWPDHPMGRPIEGTEASLDGLARAKLLRFQSVHYNPANTCISAAGKISHRALVSLVRRLTKGLQAGVNGSEFVSVPDHPKRPCVNVLRRDIEQTQIALAIDTCSRSAPQRYAVRLLSTLLAENMSSRLYQSLRERHGLAYSVSSSPNQFADIGDLTITAGVDSDRLNNAMELIQSELRRLKRRSPSADELNAACEYVIGQFELYLESTENYMTWLGEGVAAHGNIASPTVVKNRLNRVTPEDIRAAAREFIRPDRMTLAVVTPRKAERGLQSYLDC